MSATVLTLSETIRMDDLVNQQVHTLTLPEPYGSGLSCAASYSGMIADLAAGDLPLAIRLANHLTSAWGLRMMQAEAGNPIDSCFANIRSKGMLLASLNEIDFNEREPETSGGGGAIQATAAEGGMRFNGVRQRVHMDAHVQYLPMCGIIHDKNGSSSFAVAVIPITREGVSMQRCPDVCQSDEAGFTAIESYSVRLQDVFVPNNELVSFTGQESALLERFLLLHRLNVSAIYLGIAKSALACACDSAKASFVPQWGLPLSRFPGTQFLVADAAILLEACESQLYTYSSRINELFSGGGDGRELVADTGLLTMEYMVTATQKIVNYAMKIAGISSIRANHPLAKLYGTLKSSSFDLGQMESDDNREQLARALLRSASAG
ncbi:Acyl-CoA dehydrogenase type 2 domain protein [Paenibacillus curdlanolyticus YK9]|uniref:Acyl-CoA dehydrogenase type 2 domain protein n=1 Tax=Paenibacillus curdlanolyticus YK9 TaxID=717606 RepID=E0ICY3_9BACL|nr:acyl-CoA dehydrogenase family protein [Paenibacillus curdlanolyticus]EFM09698.1 Acyl-CoA dehydrogenase type 2 domain protein [Paenibacillus curdlanolyticus YK9]